MEKIKLTGRNKCSLTGVVGGGRSSIDHLWGHDGYVNSIWGLTPKNEAHLAYLMHGNQSEFVWSDLWGETEGKSLTNAVQHGRYAVLCTEYDPILIKWDGDLFIKLSSETMPLATDALTALYSECFLIRGFEDYYIVCRKKMQSNISDVQEDTQIVDPGLPFETVLDQIFDQLEKIKLGTVPDTGSEHFLFTDFPVTNSS